MVNFDDVREIAAALPEVVEGLSFDTPSLKVRKKGLAWLRNDGVLVLKLPMEHREALVHSEPEKFFLEPHYFNYPCVLVRLEVIKRDELADLMEDAWRGVAPKRVVAAFDAAAPVRVLAAADSRAAALGSASAAAKVNE